MIFCENCGASFGDNDRFCQQCGSPRGAGVVQQQAPPQYAYQPAQYGQPVEQPRVIAVLPEAKMVTPAGQSELYTIIFTPNRAIIARLTSEVLQDVMRQSQAQSRNEGKGWMGRASAQRKDISAAHMRYFEMTPEQILAETPGNFAIDNVYVTAVGVKLVYVPTNDDGPGDPYAEISFDIPGNQIRFRLRMAVKDVTGTLDDFYPGKIMQG